MIKQKTTSHNYLITSITFEALRYELTPPQVYPEVISFAELVK